MIHSSEDEKVYKFVITSVMFREVMERLKDYAAIVGIPAIFSIDKTQLAHHFQVMNKEIPTLNYKDRLVLINGSHGEAIAFTVTNRCDDSKAAKNDLVVLRADRTLDSELF